MSIELGIFSSIKNNAVFQFGSFQKCLDAVTVSDQCDQSREADERALEPPSLEGQPVLFVFFITK